MEDGRRGTQLERGAVIGLGYCLVGIAVGLGADAVGGWFSAPIWLLAAVLVAAGLWTMAFTGGLLMLVKRATAKSPRRKDGPSDLTEPDRD